MGNRRTSGGRQQVSLTAIIGGVERHMRAWKPSRRKLQGIPHPVSVMTTPMQYEIPGFPLDFDQGSLGSCGPNSVAEVYAHDHQAEGLRFSRLFLYWFCRATEGDFIDDTGVEIPDLMSIAHTMGMPIEDLWPYDLGKFQVPPPVPVLVEAVKHRVQRYDVISDLDSMLVEIASGQPVTFGFNVPASMTSDECARTGIVNLPGDTDPVIGGHCVNAIGFDRGAARVKCTSHYGPNFGDHGAIWLPFQMWRTGNAMDMFAIRSVS